MNLTSIRPISYLFYMQSTVFSGRLDKTQRNGKSNCGAFSFFWAYIFSLVVLNQNPGTGKEFSNMMFFFFSVLQVQSYCK